MNKAVLRFKKMQKRKRNYLFLLFINNLLHQITKEGIITIQQKNQIVDFLIDKMNKDEEAENNTP